MKWLCVYEVAEKLSMSTSLVWKLSSQKVLPQPLKLPGVNKTVWVESEIEAWMQATAAAARAPA